MAKKKISVTKLPALSGNLDIDSNVDILLNEYNLANERIESFQARQDTLVNICLVIMGGVIGFTLLNHSILPDEIYAFIPLIPLILFSHVSYHYTRVMANQGYRKYLEDRLNEQVKGFKLNYSTIAEGYLLKGNISATINTVMIIILIGLSFAYPLVMTWFNAIVFCIICSTLLLVLFCAVKVGKSLNGLKDKVYNLCDASAEEE